MLLPEQLTQIISLLGHVATAQGSGASAIESSSHLPAGPLPAGGDWTEQAPYPLPAGARRVGFLVRYTGAVSGAQLALRVRKGFIPPGASAVVLAAELSIDDAAALAGATGTQLAADQVLVRPVSDTAETAFAVDVDIAGGWTHVVLELAELGAVATPGLAEIHLAGSY